MEWGTVIAAVVTTVGGVGVVMVQQGYAGGGRDYRRLRRLAELLAVLPAYSEAHRIVAGRLDRETREYFRTGVDPSLPDALAIPRYPDYGQYTRKISNPATPVPAEGPPAYDFPWPSGPQAPAAPPPSSETAAAESVLSEWLRPESPAEPEPPTEPAGPAEPAQTEGPAADADEAEEEPDADDRRPPPSTREAPPWQMPSAPPPPRSYGPTHSDGYEHRPPSYPSGPSSAPRTSTASPRHDRSGPPSRGLDRLRNGLTRLPGVLTAGPILSMVAMAAAVLLQLLGHDLIGTVLSVVAVALTLLSLVGLLLRRSARDRR